MTESFFSLLAFVFWYSYSVTRWAKDAVYSTLDAGAGIPPNTEGFAAFALMFLHPVTWLITWCAVEGDGPVSKSTIHWNALGILPPVLLDKIWARFTSRVRAECPADMGSSWSSFLPWVRQRVASLRHPVLPDEVRYSADAMGEVMSISSSRPKSGWSLHALSAVRTPTIAGGYFGTVRSTVCAVICCGASQRVYLGAR